MISFFCLFENSVTNRRTHTHKKNQPQIMIFIFELLNDPYFFSWNHWEFVFKMMVLLIKLLCLSSLIIAQLILSFLFLDFDLPDRSMAMILALLLLCEFHLTCFFLLLLSRFVHSTSTAIRGNGNGCSRVLLCQAVTLLLIILLTHFFLVGLLIYLFPVALTAILICELGFFPLLTSVIFQLACCVFVNHPSTLSSLPLT